MAPSRTWLGLLAALCAVGVVLFSTAEGVDARGRGGGGGGRGGGGMSRGGMGGFGGGGFSRSGPASGGSIRHGGSSTWGGARPSTRPAERPGDSGDRWDDRQDHRQDQAKDRQEFRQDQYDEYYEDRWKFAVGASLTAAAFSSLTCASNTVVVGSVTFYHCGSTWYNRAYSGGSVTYVVVNAPAGY